MRRSLEAFLIAESILEDDAGCSGKIEVGKVGDNISRGLVSLHGNVAGHIMAAYAILSAALELEGVEFDSVTVDDMIGAVDIYKDMVEKAKVIKVNGLGGSDDFKNLFSE